MKRIAKLAGEWTDATSSYVIHTQIPWATAGAERSRAHAIRSDDRSTRLVTTEEQLLADLLGANEELIESMRMYDDLQRLRGDREAEERSRQDIRMNAMVSFG